MVKRESCSPSFFLLVTIILVGVLGCSDDEPNIATPIVVDDPWAISLVRTDWFWASVPFFGSEYLANHPDQRSFDPQDRVEAVRWFIPKERTLRRYLNPDLINQERDETQPSMNLYLRADEGVWDPDNWGGIMQGISRTGTDLSQAQYVEIWINDGVPDINERRGRVHIDFGYINEDEFWPVDSNGDLVIGTRQQEDGIVPGTFPDGIFNAPEEDIGLDGNENGPQRFDPAYEISGDSPFPRINGTARNGREDTEDLNGDDALNTDNGFYTVTIDLQATQALVDVVYDYDEVQDLVDMGIAWRKYRIPLVLVDEVSRGAVPDLAAVTHVRIWYEDPNPGARSALTLQFSEFKYVDGQNH